MPRRALREAGGYVFHVINRSARRSRLFFTEADYACFESTLGQALTRHPTRLLSYCVMPNHWHLVLWPLHDELPRFMHWLTLVHAQRWHQARETRGSGHVYQSRYRAIAVQGDQHLVTVLRYVERNPVRAGLVERAESWRWGSLWRRCNNRTDLPVAEWPFPRSPDWSSLVNVPEPENELAAVRRAAEQNRPFGDRVWGAETATLLGLPRRPGRPRTKPDRV
jgi:putative transposase